MAGATLVNLMLDVGQFDYQRQAERDVEQALREEEVDKMQPVLFPPGECIHFYQDGSGISGAYVPCNFFKEVSYHFIHHLLFMPS